VKTTNEAIESIRNDNVAGAQSITHRAAAIVEQYLHSVSSTSVDIKQHLLDLGQDVINAQPVMAPLFNLFDSLLRKFDVCRDRPERREILRDHVQAFSRAMNDHTQVIAEHVSRMIPHGGTVFTHSDSSALRAALQHCHSEGKLFSVYCTESRPACEGIRLAQALVEHGISTCLVTDTLIFALLRESRNRSVLLVGADSINTHGVINKAGTAGLAIATKSWGIPLYVLAGSEKFLPAGFFPTVDQDKPPDEILSQPPTGLRIINRYFDVTPLDSITGVVSEEGLLSGADLHAKLERLRAHPDLIATLNKDSQPGGEPPTQPQQRKP